MTSQQTAFDQSRQGKRPNMTRIHWLALAMAVLAPPACTTTTTEIERRTIVAPFADAAAQPVPAIGLDIVDADLPSVRVFWEAHPATAVTAYRVARSIDIGTGATGTPGLLALGSSIRQDFDADGRRTTWSEVAALEWVDSPQLYGRTTYFAVAVFPDGTTSAPSDRVTFDASTGSVAVTRAVTTPAEPGTEPPPPSEPCLTVAQLLATVSPALQCFDLLAYADPGSDLTFDTADDVTSARSLIAVTDLSQLYLRRPDSNDEIVLRFEFVAPGPDAVWGTADDLLGEVIDRRDNLDHGGGVSRERVYRQASTSCVHATGDLKEIRQVLARNGDEDRRLVYDGPGVDDSWLTTDDRLDQWERRYYDGSDLITASVYYALPGNDLSWLTADDFAIRAARRFWNASDRLTATTVSGDPGPDHIFLTDDDVPASISLFPRNATGATVAAYSYALPDSTPLEGLRLDYVDDVVASAREVTAGTDEIYGTTDDVTTGFAKVISYACPTP